MVIVLIIPLWQTEGDHLVRGMEGDFKNKCFLMINS